MTQNERLESVLAAAKQHGKDSEPDHEVGDLQDCLRAAIACMSLDHFDMFMRTPAVLDTLEWGGGA